MIFLYYQFYKVFGSVYIPSLCSKYFLSVFQCNRIGVSPLLQRRYQYRHMRPFGQLDWGHRNIIYKHQKRSEPVQLTENRLKTIISTKIYLNHIKSKKLTRIKNIRTLKNSKQNFIKIPTGFEFQKIIKSSYLMVCEKFLLDVLEKTYFRSFF